MISEMSEDNKWQVYTHGGREKTGLEVIEWCQKVISLGATLYFFVGIS